MKKLQKIIIILSIVLLSFPIITSAESTSEKQVSITNNNYGETIIGKRFSIDRTADPEKNELLVMKFSIGYNREHHEIMPWVVVIFEKNGKPVRSEPQYLWDGFDFVELANTLDGQPVFLFVFKSYQWIMYMKYGIHGFMFFEEFGKVEVDVPPWVFTEINEALEIYIEVMDEEERKSK